MAELQARYHLLSRGDMSQKSGRAEQSAAFGDSASVAERLMHRARAGEIVLSGDIVKLAGGANAARPLPSLQSARRAAIPIYGIVLESRLPLA